mgnify:CR=1 FL=1
MQARKTKGMTQDTLAQLVNVSRQTVSHWENGRAMPDVATAAQLSKVLDVNFLADEAAEDTAVQPPEAVPTVQEPVQETQELFCQFGVLGVGRNLKLLNGAHNIAGLAVIQNGCAGQTKLKAVSAGSIGHFAFHPVAVGDEQSLVHHHVSLALGMVQSNGAIHQVAIAADLCHVLEDLEGLIRAEGAGRVGGDCLHVVDAGGRSCILSR